MSVDPASALDVPDAGTAIASLLAREDGEPDVPETAPESAPAEQEAPAEESAETETPETASAEDAGEEEQAAAEEGATPEEEPQEPPKYTVTVEGAPQEVTLEELQRGYIAQRTFTQRSQKLAEERKSHEAEFQAVSQERAEYARVLPALKQRLEALAPQPPDERLRAEDPVQYILQRDAYNQHREQIAAAEQELVRVQGVQTQEQQQHFARQVAEGKRKLLEAMPAWRDEKKFKEVIGELREFGLTHDFTEKELDQLYDHRAFLLLWKAAQFDKLAKAKPPVPTPKAAPKAASAGSAVRTPGRVTELTRAKQRLAQTGDVNDAAAYFLKSGHAE